MGRGLHTVLVRCCAPPPSLVRALLRHAGVGSPCGRDPRGSGWGRWGGRCAGQAATPPPPVSRSLPGEGGRPLGSGGAEGRSCGFQAGGGGAGGGGWPAIRCLWRAPEGYTRAVGAAWRPRASGAAWSAANGSVRRGRGGGGGRNPPALVRALVFPGPASDRAAPSAPSWAPPVRRRLAAGRACGRLPQPSCPRTPGAAASSGGGCGAAVSSVCLRPLLGLTGRGGGKWGGPSGPPAPPPDGRGGGGMAVPATGASHRLGGRTLPPTPST